MESEDAIQMDPMSIAASLGAASAAAQKLIGLLRNSAETAKQMGRGEVVSDLVEAQVTMMDLLAKHQALLEEKRELQEQVHTLEAKLNTVERLEHHFEVYWVRQDDESLEGPFDPAMWDKHQTLARLRCAGRGQFGASHYGDQQCFKFYYAETKQQYLVPAEFLEQNNVRVYHERAR
jgi:hypothetical protein